MKMLHGVTKGLPQTGLQGGAGVAVFYLHRMLASKMAFLQNHPLAAPLGMVAIGHVLKKSSKLGTAGAAIIGAGGYAAAQVYEVKKSLQAAPAPAAAGTSGFDDETDTGALISPSDIGALVASSDIGDLPENDSTSYADAYGLSQ